MNLLESVKTYFGIKYIHIFICTIYLYVYIYIIYYILYITYNIFICLDIHTWISH